MSAQSAYAANLPPNPHFAANHAARWRRQSSHQQQQQQQQQTNSGGQRGSHSQAQSRDRSAGGGGGSGSGVNAAAAAKQQGVSSYAGNAWGGDKGRAGEGQRQQQGGQRGGAGAGAAQQSQQEAHVPVRGFNAMETKAFLKRRSQAAHFSAGTSTIYKVQGDLGQRVSGPWGSKPNAMANGQDFWVQLRKQVGNLESGRAS